MVETIGEPVDVFVLFCNGRLSPRVFMWSGRRYIIREVTASWSSYEETAKLFCFSVLTDGANLYELVYNSRTIMWCLASVEHGLY
jgi:hypothetical protein